MLVFKMADEIVRPFKEGVYTACAPYGGPLVSISDARSAGLTRYFTGKPCPQGHVVERRVSNWKCLQCARDEFSATMRVDPVRSRARAKAYAKRHPEKVATYKQRWAAENDQCLREQRREFRSRNAERLKTDKRNYYFANRERELAKAALWQRTNTDKVKVRNAKWATANPDAVRSTVRRRRARLRGAEGNHTGSDILALFDQQQGFCAACSVDIRNAYHVDHKMPLSRGGSNGPENLQLLCQFCNCSKGARTMKEWAERKISRGRNGLDAGLSDHSSRVRSPNFC
jgi:5-methylcytosine-specific restriction endonuclease McrA